MGAYEKITQLKNVELVSPTDLKLRRETEADAEVLFNLIDADRGHLMQFENYVASRYPTLDSMRENIVSQKDKGVLRMVIENPEGTVVGFIKLIAHGGDDNFGGEIGYWLGGKHTGHGYMTEAVKLLTQYALDVLGFEYVVAYTNPENINSNAVLERAGFANVGLVIEDSGTKIKIRIKWVAGTLLSSGIES